MDYKHDLNFNQPPYIEQWVWKVNARSSEYEGWPATNVIGPPRTYPRYGDLNTAWAPLHEKGTMEFLELEYKKLVVIEKVSVYETFNPGSLIRISTRKPSGNGWEVLWETNYPQPNTEKKARIFEPPIKKPYFASRHLKLEFDCRRNHSWTEIDAVQISGFAFY